MRLTGFGPSSWFEPRALGPCGRRLASTGRTLPRYVQRISERIGSALTRKRWLVREAEGSYLDLPPGAEGDALADLQGRSITYRITLGAHQGRKTFTYSLSDRDGLAIAHRNSGKAGK